MMTAESTVADPLPGPPVPLAPVDLRRSQRLWLVLLVVGFAVQVAWRLHLSLPLTGPTIHDDEDGYLFGARMLAGGPQATLPTWSIMRPMGYPLLLAPIYLFVQEPSKVYVGVHLINALLMAANFPLLYLLGRRLFNSGRVWTAAIAFVLALLPSLVFYGDFALTDALMPEILMVLLLAVHGMLSGRRPMVAGAAAGTIAGYAANTHVRGLVMLVALGALVLVGVWRRWITRRTAAATAAAAGGVFLSGYAINAWLEHQFFPGGAAFQVDGRVLGRLTSVQGVYRVLADGFGEIWYLCTSTYGLAGLGLAAVAVMLIRREGPLRTRIVLGLALVMTVGVALATAAGIPDEGRVNNHIYGRYVALFAGLWSLVAVVSLARAARRRSALLIAGATVLELGALGLVWLYAHARFSYETFVSFDAPELSFLSHDYRHIHFQWVTALSVGFMVAFALLFTGWPTVASWQRTVVGGRRWVAVAGVGGLLVLNVVAMQSINGRISVGSNREQYHPGPAELVRDAHVVPGSSIVEASNVPLFINQRHQREVYWESLTEFNPGGRPPGTPTYVVAMAGTDPVADWNGGRYGYTIDLTYHEPTNVTWVVWQRC